MPKTDQTFIFDTTVICRSPPYFFKWTNKEPSRSATEFTSILKSLGPYYGHVYDRYRTFYNFNFSVITLNFQKFWEIWRVPTGVQWGMSYSVPQIYTSSKVNQWCSNRSEGCKKHRAAGKKTRLSIIHFAILIMQLVVTFSYYFWYKISCFPLDQCQEWWAWLYMCKLEKQQRSLWSQTTQSSHKSSKPSKGKNCWRLQWKPLLSNIQYLF